jgi:hypothetical protein
VGVVLVALDIGFHELRGNRFDRMTQFLDLPCPVVRASAGFHPHQTGRQVGEKGQHVLAFEGFTENFVTPLVSAKSLEDMVWLDYSGHPTEAPLEPLTRSSESS